MRVRTLSLLTVCVAVASLAAPQLARGVAVTITYEIGGGTFDGPFSQGPVTGGTLVVRFPNAVSLFSAPAPASLPEAAVRARLERSVSGDRE